MALHSYEDVQNYLHKKRVLEEIETSLKQVIQTDRVTFGTYDEEFSRLSIHMDRFKEKDAQEVMDLIEQKLLGYEQELTIEIEEMLK